MDYRDLPEVNALLNGTSAVLLTCGFIAIKRGRVNVHRRCMVGAVVTSSLFLVCYLVYHALMRKHTGQGHTSFVNPAWFRPIYLTILYTHLAAAVTIVPMVIITLSRALRQQFDRHKALARWTWPLWMYVSVTGVVIYFLLYQIYPQR